MSTQPGNDRSDPVGDFQRWLMKAGAKSIGREVAGRVRSTLGGGGGAKHNEDVWDTATTEDADRGATGVPVVPDLPRRPQVP